ncbi:DUF6491 family protein [Zestomonas carbonaria]|uniref:Lipoprotein n=1 Tax=Zestomonas carbonaria TaxID=2762745 RepID=A0A7U7ENV4_9GAMM|nr:DUF6491 family protein [Pseudomonas carbonaria]CAD5108058.1 hypothetical protein PSEWESI4_02342 [Pseudomonas carbonaria]
MNGSKLAYPLVIVFALLAACTGRGPADESLPLDERLARLGYQQGEAVDSVLRYRIDDWQYLDKRHIVLGGGPGPAYLVEFPTPCRNLAFNNRIAYSTTAGALTRLDKIVSTDAGGFPEHCLIGEIYRLDRVKKAKE